MLRGLAVFAVLSMGRFAAATPTCEGPVYEVATLATPSSWQLVTPLPGPASSVAQAGGTIFAAAVVEGTPRLLELVNDRWQDTPGAPAATGVAVVGDYIYALVRRDHHVEVSFARRGTTAWSPTTAAPDDVTEPFACGDALCASSFTKYNTGLPDYVRTYAATPSSTGALGSWTHVLSNGRGGGGVIGSNTSAGSMGYVLAKDGTYANAIDPGGRYRALWNRVGPPAPSTLPAAIVHDGWLFAVGGTVMDSVASLGPCRTRHRYTSSNRVYAARIAADGSVGSWRAAAPLPRGGLGRLVASAQQLYAIDSTGPSATVIPWTELVDSISPGVDPPVPPRRIPAAPARRPYAIDIPADWIEVPAEPIDPGASFALEYRTKSDPATTLHVTWIEGRDKHEQNPGDALANRLFRAVSELFGNTGMASRNPSPVMPAPSLVIDEVLVRPPHVRHIRLIGIADASAQLSIAAGACTGTESALAACERILATLRLDSQRPGDRAPPLWLLMAVFGIASTAMLVWVRRSRR